jgi:phosphate transport system substrate-binding protein
VLFIWRPLSRRVADKLAAYFGGVPQQGVNSVLRNRFLVAFGAAALLAPLAAIPAGAQTATLDKNVTVSGQGSSFMSNFMEQCKVDVKNAFGINIAYQPTGSGAGRTAYLAGTNDFGGSDVAFTSSELPRAKDKPFVYLPITIGGVAIIYKVPGVTDLKLSGPTLAKIFAGGIQKWNDDAIAKENSGVALPDQVIRVIVRSDSSGTSNVFSEYLSTVGKGAWKAGATSNFPAPAGNGIAQRGSDGVSNYVAGSQGDFAITYAEVSFATERKLGIAKVINAAGNAVAPDPANVAEAMDAAAVNDDGTLFLNYNAPGQNAYPISTTAYLIAPQTLDKAKGDVLRTFLTYSVGECQKKADKIGYAPLPASLVKLSLANIGKINPGSAAVPTVGGAATPASSAAPTTVAPVASSAAPTTKAATATTKKKTTTKKRTTTKKK